MESMLAGELRGLGADDVRQLRAGVSFSGALETAYRACLWSRLAARVLLVLRTGPAGDADALYETVRRVDWGEHLAVDGTLAVDFTGTSTTIRDTQFGAVRVKDAIVDQFRSAHAGRRPSVDARAPDVRVNAHLARGRVTVSLDLSGDSLHRRGYRVDRVQVEAPLKENLAAAVLLFAAWPQEAAAGGSFLDPLCGSGTLPIEAALIAADVAPGLLRAEGGARDERPSRRASAGARSPKAAPPRVFGLMRWKGHDAALWGTLLEEARERRDAGLSRLKAAAPGVVIRGSDHDARAIEIARSCAMRAGVADVVSLGVADLDDAAPPAPHGLVAANAPYGARMGERDEAEAVCRQFGRRLRAAFGGWRAAVLAGDHHQSSQVGLQPVRETVLRNGALDCTLALFDVDAPAPERTPREAARSSMFAAPDAESAAGQLANRLRKNLRHIGRAMRRRDVGCYRLYDADLPEYNLAVDVYEGWLHVQEYAPPPEIDPDRAAAHLAEAVDVLADVVDVQRDRIVVKQRRRMRGAEQYQRHAPGGNTLPVTEDGLTYLVDLESYLDTGLFLDQRETRRLIRRLAGGRRFLNLFAYTSTATVCAIAGGAPSTTSVDLSATYLQWSRRNLAENGVTDVVLELAHDLERGRDAGRRPVSGRPAGVAHRLVQADCLRWIAEAEGQYDLIFLDPPSFSNSKRMGGATFDVQRDHPDLIRMTARRLLAPRGTLLFSSNRRGFALDPATFPALALKDLSRATLAPDFARRANAHHVWRIEAR
jgi:23S rRNA (guanine2445-N2)-methyltransferase / 23S rRNA (guanine2069-N7)-methyltransferase